MPDITMCNNKSCVLRKNCYRFMAKPNEHRQSYCFFKPTNNKCEYFLILRGAKNEQS